MIKHFKNIFLAVMILICGTTLAGCGQSDSGTQEQYLHMATGNTAGTYYPIGGAISEVLNQNIKNMHSSVQSTSGSVANLQFLADGAVELAIVQNDIAYYAVNGQEMFADQNKYKFDTLRGITALYPESCQIVTLESSGINSIADLKGKKVVVGAEGSGAEANARQILAAYGITYTDIEPQFLSFSVGAKALSEGTVDAAFLTAGFPTNAIQYAASQAKIKLLGIDDEHFKALSEKYPFYNRITIPKGTYSGVNEDIQTVAIMALLVCNDRVSADTAYQVTKTIYEHLDKIKESHYAISKLEKSAAEEGMTIKIQEGAEKFLR